MKVVSYNCFEGAQHTRDYLVGCLNNLNADVVQLQEINGWGEGSATPFQRFAQEGHYAAAVFGNSNTRFKLGTYARPTALHSEVLTQGFWHSAIHTELPYHDGSLYLWNVHLNPRAEDDRLCEIDAILEAVDFDSYTLITGDFNSLARYDTYNQQSLLEELRVCGLKKFGETALRFDVIDRLNEAGLVDIGSRYLWQNTVPTPANTDTAHATDLRLDYAFATPKLAKRVSGYRVVKDELSDRASDHYPIEITFN